MTSALVALVCLGAPAPVAFAPLPFDGGTFLALYGQRAYAWLCHLWHTGHAHGGRLTETLGAELGEHALRLLVQAGWVERQAFEPGQAARVRASMGGAKTATEVWGTERDYGYAPVRSSALRAVIAGCQPPPYHRCWVGVRAWPASKLALELTVCGAEVPPVEWPGGRCSTTPALYHRLLVKRLRGLVAERLARRVRQVRAAWAEQRAAYVRRCEAAEAGWAEVEPSGPKRPRGGGRKRAAAAAR